MMDFQSRELILELAYLCDVCVHGVLVDVLLLVDLLDHQQGVDVDKQLLDAQRDYQA
jgi:hypothetical protein